MELDCLCAFLCVPLCHSETRIFTAGVWDGTGEENEYFYASNRNSILDTPYYLGIANARCTHQDMPDNTDILISIYLVIADTSVYLGIANTSVYLGCIDARASRNYVAIFHEMYAPTHEIGLSNWRKHHRITIASKKSTKLSHLMFMTLSVGVNEWYIFGMENSLFLSDSVNVSMQHAVKFSNMYAI
ncbi:hypothetical protein CEXT_226781 [Caerostris extrusa]|uniref:Farnesoic acid O-methyl transferase domain-containing protein n=1 Tax=Caerostris extrusa TaxID=172846 RepID=A0AAV4P6U1_CAEEX|nr:hypothetical protein CEXT_226781 [Caerostris extrusa]